MIITGYTMAKVYNGRITIPGDKLDEYFKLLADAEKQREPFRQSLLQLNDEFDAFLSAKFTERTVYKHIHVTSLFIEFICRNTDVETIEEITRGMVNTHFKKWWRKKVWDSTEPDQLRTSLKKFFNFLKTEKKIVNERVLKALQ